jgi:tetratricopeptide (TPR) repeat protein
MSRKGVLLLSWWLAACGASGPSEAQTAAQHDQAAARALFDRGIALTREGDSVRAEQYLAASMREGYDWEVALPLLMRVCLTGSRLRAALNYASPYLKKYPDAVWLRYLVATVYLGLGQPLHAREHLLAIQGLPPYEARTEYLLGQTEWEGFGDATAATRHYREYLRLEPNGPNAREVGEWLEARPEEPAPRTALAPPTRAPEAKPHPSSTVVPVQQPPSTVVPVEQQPSTVVPVEQQPSTVVPVENPPAVPAPEPTP